MIINHTQSLLIKEYQAQNRLQEITKVLDLTFSQCLSHTRYKGFRIDRDKYKKSRVITKRNLEREAMIIEAYMCNPDLALKEVAKRFNLTESHVSRITSRYFAYKGDDPTTITLKSKV